MFDTPVIYGFISDDLFWNKQLVDLNKSVVSEVGFIDDVTINYFNKIGYLNDPRTTRIDSGGVTLVGKIKLFFDVSKLAEVNPFVDMDNDRATVLMNIIEKCYVTQNRTDVEINQELLQDDATKSLYVINSFKRASSYITTVPPTMETSLRIYDYVEFDIRIGEDTTRFKLWLNLDKFKRNYPLTTIVKVIPPCKEQYILDPSLLTSDVNTVVESGEYIFNKTHAGALGIDYTGIVSFKTKWVVSSQSTPEIRFGIMYQGATPSSLEIREAIRNYLGSLGIAPENTWEARLPDLYVTAQFFLVPLWGNKVARPNNKYGYIFPAITNYNYISETVQRILPEMELPWLSEYTEVLINPYNSILLTSVPDPLNKIGYFKLNELLETYQAYAPDDINYTYQELNAKEFSRKLGNVMAMLYGGAISSTEAYVTNTFYGRRYLSFSSQRVEYHVLYQEDYDITVED